MVRFLSFLTILAAIETSAQGDMIVIRKGDRTIKTIMKGSVTSLLTRNGGQLVNAQITDIRRDSIFYKELVVRQVPTALGVSHLDTMATSIRSLHYNDIAGIPRSRKFGQLSAGNILVLGGGGLLAVNLINAVYLNYPPFAKDNLSNILPASAALVTGIVLNKLRKNFYFIGKKNSLRYIPMHK